MPLMCNLCTSWLLLHITGYQKAQLYHLNKIWEGWEDEKKKAHGDDKTQAHFSQFVFTSRGPPGELLRYISDGDVRSPFLGLKFAI